MVNQTPWIDQKYISFAINRLDQGQKIKDTEWVARCPVCGDSKKDIHKRRFHISLAKGEYLCHCFNCDYAATFHKFLKDYFPDLYSDYRVEKLKERYSEPKPIIKKGTGKKELLPDNTTNTNVLKHLKPISKGDSAYTYLQFRGVEEYINKYFFYTDNFQEFINRYRDDKKVFAGPCIVIPLFNFDKKIVGFQARVLPEYQDKINMRYYTIRIDDNERAMFVPLHIDLTKPVYVVEGVFDALMLPNAISNLSSALLSLEKHVPDGTKLIYFYDNEPRHKEIMSLLKRTAKTNCVVVPDGMPTKDLNEWVTQYNISKQDLAEFVEKHTYCPPKSQLMVAKYAKI